VFIKLTIILKWMTLMAIAALFVGIASHLSYAQGASDSESNVGSVVPIGPNDSLNINVIGEPDLSTTYLVDANGDISMLYVGKVHVGGLTPDQACSLVQGKLSQIYTSPQVTVARPAIGGIIVTVIGAVTKQGDNQVRRDSHLNDVVQLAGPSPDADLEHINITSGNPGQRHTTVTYDLTTFLNAGAPDGNPPLDDGDQVFIPKKTQTNESVSVLDQVSKPGRYDVAPGTTAVDLINSAGGMAPGGDPTATYIKEMGSDTQIPFNYVTAAQNPSNAQLNPVLKDGDEIVVPLATSVPTYAILGGVLKPGEYPLHGQVSLLDAIAMAGGIQAHAKTKKTSITRNTPQGPTVIVMNSDDTKKASLFYLQEGDNITIPPGDPPRQFGPLEALGTLGTILSIFRL
jgi:polysaccharide biosynthesis/export protein